MDKKPLLEFIGNIISISSFIEDIKIKMMFLFDELKILQIKKNQITHYYAIEKNPNDNYYHEHFLFDCAKDMNVIEDIEYKLANICEPNTLEINM
jgi:hypothetical protein